MRLSLPAWQDLYQSQPSLNDNPATFFTSSQEAIEQWIDESFEHYNTHFSNGPPLLYEPFMLQDVDDFAAEPSDPGQRLCSDGSESLWETCVDVETGQG